MLIKMQTCIVVDYPTVKVTFITWLSSAIYSVSISNQIYNMLSCRFRDKYSRKKIVYAIVYESTLEYEFGAYYVLVHDSNLRSIELKL